MSNLAPFTEPGSAVEISGENVVVSSGAISVVSGSITVNSGTVAVSGLFAGASGGAGFQSGAGAVSGAIPVTAYLWDYSGVKWNPMGTGVSGSNAQLNIAQTPTKIRIGLSGIGFENTASGAAVNSGIPSSSGGVLLYSGDTNMVILRNNPGNNYMYVGSSGERPCSGFGFKLAGGDGITIPITNFNLIAVFAATSGQYISFMGMQY